MEFIRPKKATLSLDMAPLIDIVFQLLIFFMLSSSFLTPAMKLTLPRAVTEDSRQPERVVISLDRDGNTYVNTRQVPRAELRAAVEGALAAASDKSVHIRGDQEMPYKHFVEVMDLARQAGARQVNIVHEQAGAS